MADISNDRIAFFEHSKARQRNMTALNSHSSPRLEATLKVTGSARYEGDAQYKRQVHAALVPAPIANGRILRIDSARARTLPGFVAIMTHENAPRIPDAMLIAHAMTPIVLQVPTIHFAGQPVAVVVAETLELARQAAATVDVTYEKLPAITGVEQALDHSFAPESAGYVATDSLRGDPKRGRAESTIAIKRRYTTPTNNHHPLERHFVIASWNGDDLTVHTTTQAVFSHRQRLADCLSMPGERIRIVSRYLGGGFGGKGASWFPCILLGVMVAKHAGLPVKLELTRSQMFTLVGRRQETIQRVELAATREGRLTAISHDTIAQTSTYGEYADPTGSMARMLYACANVSTSHRLVRVNAPQPNPMRAPGEGTGSFALESAIDELAYELRLDPLEMRLRNYADHDQDRALPWSSNGLRECYRVAAEAFGWKDRPRACGSLRDGRSQFGWGMASACYPVYRVASEAAIRIGRNGRVRVQCGTQDIGTGTETVLAQVAALKLGVPICYVTAELGDTHLPAGPASAAGHVTASITPAVEKAASTLRRRLIEMAVRDPRSRLCGLSADLMTIADGTIKGPSGELSESLFSLLARSDKDELVSVAHVVPDEQVRYSAYGYGAVFVEVRVEPRLGVVRVTRVTAAYASGRIINPLLARSQLVGGLVFGIGMALHEATIMDERFGCIVNDNLADYLIPVHADMPRFDVRLVDEDDPYLAGGGVKGVGMIGPVGVAAAIANAVFHATGRRIRDLPIRLEHFLDCPS
jgi:xanthine dehydrogenase YagR molybdenum-binding subunit